MDQPADMRRYDDDEAAAFYENPENRRATGPGYKRRRIVGWRCEHLTVTGGPFQAFNVTTNWCDCVLEPIYA